VILDAIYGFLRYNSEEFSKFYTLVFTKGPIDGVSRVHTALPGRLGIIEDSELKKRIIGMIDYHSQWVLRPVHDRLMSCLRHFPSDRTYTQDPHNTWLGNDGFHSLDLSAATDRFPISLQVKLMRNIFSHELAMD
jgi:hypothetical protein